MGDGACVCRYVQQQVKPCLQKLKTDSDIDVQYYAFEALEGNCTQLYTVNQKTVPLHIQSYFDKCWPIFTILLLLYFPRNLQQDPCCTAHHDLDVSLCWKFKIQPFLIIAFANPIWKSMFYVINLNKVGCYHGYHFWFMQPYPKILRKIASVCRLYHLHRHHMCISSAPITNMHIGTLQQS